MRITKQIWRQLAILFVVSVVAMGFMLFGYMRLPYLLFGAGHYGVTLQLPEAAGLYERANVTYRGTTVGQVKAVRLTDRGVDADLSLKSGVAIPSDLDAEVHSTSAVGEQYVALLPRTDAGPPLRDGDVITEDAVRIPSDVNDLLDATDRGLLAIPGDNLKTVVDESYSAFGGLGPDLGRLIRNSSKLAIDAKANLDEITTLVDGTAPILDSQTDTSNAIADWASNMAEVTGQLRDSDVAVQGVLQDGPAAVGELRDLLDRWQPTIPVLAANLASVAPVLVAYSPSLEQILVLLPMGAQMLQGVLLPNRGTSQPYKGAHLSFNLNLNLPPPCTTGYLPAQQQRNASFEDAPDRPEGELYCRVPQDSMFNVRGARNTPCVTRQGKRAPTARMCESDEEYVPLNDGYNWKGDPNATLSGQGIPQLPPAPAALVPPPATDAQAPPIAVAEYDPATGAYVGPDGRTYTRADVAESAEDKTWQTLLLPPGMS